MKNNLFFVRYPAIVFYFSFLDATDKTILGMIINGKDNRKKLSLREFQMILGIGRNSVIYSLNKLCFSNLIKRVSRYKDGYQTTNEYVFNPNQNEWRLHNSLRKFLNQEEALRGITPSIGMNDFIDHFVWILSFEKSQPDYLCRYLDFKTKNLNPKVVKDSKMWDMYYLKGFEKKETNLKSLEEVIELDSHTKKTNSVK